MFTFRPATPDDADEIATIVSLTSEGTVSTLFDNLVPGLPGETILSTAFSKGEGPYSTENVIVSCHDDGKMTSLLFAYPSHEHVVPPLMESFIPQKRLEPVRAILEVSIPDSLYINTFWITESARGTGLADALMLEAKSLCQSLELSHLCLFCWKDNTRALRFYEKQGFVAALELPAELIPVKGHEHGGLLLCKTLVLR